MGTPLFDAVTRHIQQGRAPFHVPGHKGGAPSLLALADALKYDLTELPDLGSLFDSQGPTAEAERLASQLFSVPASLMSAGGCTLCIQAMLRLAAPGGGKMVCGRVIHRSAVNTMALLGIEPVWVMPDVSAGPAFTGRIDAGAVTRALEEHPDAKAVYLTTPDYFGVLSDVTAIAAAAERFGVPVIVDNAHGAHLRFLGKGLGPLERGAAMSADSAHKTLPVLTGGAWLNIADQRYAAGAKQAMALFGSTSPSYPVMMSLDLCREWLATQGGEELRRLEQSVAAVKRAAAAAGLLQPAGECDPLRLAFAPAEGPGGENAGDYLRANGIEPEYSGSGGTILIPSPMNTPAQFDRLLDAVGRMRPAEPEGQAQATAPRPVCVMSPREAILAPAETVPLNAAEGRVCAEAMCRCPPAIPLAMPGELLTPETIFAARQVGYRYVQVVKQQPAMYNIMNTF